MRTRHARLLWSVPLLAALACGGEAETTGPTTGGAEGLTAAAPSGGRVIEISPSTDPVSFGTVQAPFGSATPKTQTFTVTNVGTKVTSGLAVSITGPARPPTASRRATTAAPAGAWRSAARTSRAP